MPSFPPEAHPVGTVHPEPITLNQFCPGRGREVKEMFQAAALVTLVYGVLVFLGGLIGYLKAKSKPSLIMGGLFGIALAAVGVAGLQGWRQTPLYGAGLSLFLLAFFGLRYARKKKFMPAGMLTALSFASVAVNIAAILVAQAPSS
jgi:uncharacterized membrane protein (UPF0136 family)